MGVQKLQVLFDRPLAVYHPGQHVSGRILLVVDEPMKVRGLFVKVLGIAEAQWREHELRYCLQPTNVTYIRKEVYFDRQTALVGGGNEEETIPVGKHLYSFDFVLPTNIPSSFREDVMHLVGGVKYTVQAVLDRPWRFDRKETKTFAVISPLDLNAYPELQKPLIENTERTVNFLCHVSGVVTINFTLPRCGAVPEETIFPTLVIENNSSVHVGPIKIKLVEETILKAGEKTDESRRTMSEKSLGYVDAGKSKVFDREAFPIPALPPSNLYTCGIIDVTYCLEAHCSLPSFPVFYKRTIVKLPVVMGTIPFQRKLVNCSP